MSNDIAIIGTGLTGMAQALALAMQDIPVTLIGPAPMQTDDRRTTAILNPGITFLDSLDLWDDLKTSATPLSTMELIDGGSHTVFDASEIEELQFGFNISNHLLKKELVNELERHPLIIWHKITANKPARTENGWKIILDNGHEILCHLLIGADGRNSLTREAANILTTEKDIDQTALVGVLLCEKPHFNTTVEWYRQGGPLTLVPVEKNKFALVWCGPTNDQMQQKRATKSANEAELTAITEQRFGKITLENNLQSWQVCPMLAASMIADNCVLIGEAAHVLPPIGAQGFNLGLQDAQVLTNILSTAKNTGQNFNNPVLLQRYHRKRYTEIQSRYQAINALNTTLLSRNFMLHKLRQASLSGLQHFSFMKKHLMQTFMTPAK